VKHGTLGYGVVRAVIVEPSDICTASMPCSDLLLARGNGVSCCRTPASPPKIPPLWSGYRPAYGLGAYFYVSASTGHSGTAAHSRHDPS